MLSVDDKELYKIVINCSGSIIIVKINFKKYNIMLMPKVLGLNKIFFKNNQCSYQRLRLKKLPKSGQYQIGTYPVISSTIAYPN